MTDPIVIGKRLAKLREYASYLRILRGRARPEFIEDPFVFGNIERYLQLSIQVVLDISNHVVADDRLGAVEEYRDAHRHRLRRGALHPPARCSECRPV
ncbi:MAG: HepT-like ribonuclease domain-containing protein [Acidobacteriota bacterium]